MRVRLLGGLDMRLGHEREDGTRERRTRDCGHACAGIA
jgi:hypothetical protein